MSSRWVLLAAAAVATALATGRFSIAMAAWVAPVLLLRASRAPRLREGLLPVAIIFATAFAVAWAGTFGMPAWLWGALGLVYFLPWVVDRALAPRLPAGLGTLVLPTAWVGFEFALVSLPVLNGQPLGSWGAVAYSQWELAPLVQLVSVTGLWGVTFLIGWTSAVVNLAWERGWQGDEARRHGTACVAVVGVVLMWGSVRLATAPQPGATVRVAGVAVDNPSLTVGIWNPVARGRPVTDQDRAAMEARLDTLHDRLLEATRREARAGARLVAWAEDNAIVFKEREAALIARGKALAAEEGITLFMGIVALVPGEKAENKVVGVTAGGEVAFEYLKAYPTPWELSRAGDRVLRFASTEFGLVGAAICYDFDYPRLLRGASRAGAALMVAPSDDGMQADPLHARMAAFRAVENGFALLRPVIGGQALAVDAYGRVLARADYGEGAYFAGGTHVLVAQVPLGRVATIYGRVGDVIAWGSLAVLAGLLMIGVVRPAPPDRQAP